MKKIFLVLIVGLITVSLSGQSIFKRGVRVGNDKTGTSIVTVDSITGVGSNFKMYNGVTRLTESDVINDSLAAVRSNALNLADYAFIKADSNAYGGAMTYNGVVNYVASQSGVGGYEWTEFIVGTTTGAPANADTAFTVSQMAGDVIELYRGTSADLHRQWLNETATNGVTGYRYNSSGQVVVLPAWSTGDRAYLKAVASSAVTKDTLTGGVSTLLTGLRAGWKLDETVGTAVNDVLGTYDGTTTGTVNQTGVFGKAETFVRASAQWANLGQTVQDIGTSDFSLSAWINISTSPSATMGIAGCVYDQPYFYIGINSEDKAYAIINFGGANITLTGNSTLSTGTWYHLALTVARSGNATLYVNGASQTDVKDVSSGVAVDFVNNNSFAIGAVGNLPGYTFNGSIDDVYLWTKVLSAGELTTLQTKTHPWN